MENEVSTNFPVTVYGKMEKFNDTISRGRCRVFYKGYNRNGTFITDEFAQKLIASAPYTPIKGIYNDVNGDYTDHGTRRNEGRIYGVVPADPHFAWERYRDEDGVEREYACFDVLYYTALYQEAGAIDGKSESMELYRQTLKGEWQVINGKKAYVFTDGCFLGLQALGDDVEPCFEGASFYSCENNIVALLEKYEKRLNFSLEAEQGGNDTMPNAEFKISDNQKYNMLFNLLNPNFNEAGGWALEKSICEVYDDYAVVVNYSDNTFERVYYVKDDASDSLRITESARCYIVDVSEEELNALKTLKGEGTYAHAVEVFAEKENTINGLTNQVTELTALNENLTNGNSEYSTKVAELETTISTLEMERDEARTNYESAQARVTEVEAANTTLTANLDSMTAERDSLAAYKKKKEDDAKKAVISNYAEILPEEVIANYLTNLDQYSIQDLDKELTYEQKKANPTLFTKTPAPAPEAFVPKDEDCGRSINDILVRYEKH